MLRKQPLNDKKKKKENSLANLFFLSKNSGSHPLSQSEFCTADQCSIPQTTTVQTSPSTVNLQPTFESLYNTTLIEESELSHLLPPELYQAMLSAAKQGILTGFLVTLTEQLLTDYLKSKHYQPEQIYWANQAVRALTLITIGTSAYIAIGLPVANYLMTTCGFNRETATYLPMGLLLFAGFCTNPFTLFAATVITGFIVNMLSTQVTKGVYGLAKNSIFTIKDNEEKEWQGVPDIQNRDAQVKKHM